MYLEGIWSVSRCLNSSINNKYPINVRPYKTGAYVFKEWY